MSAVEAIEPRERSEAQTQASRANGNKSKGPVSDEGKAKSSRNGVRHGLCSGKVVFDDPEAEAEFEAMRVGLEEVYIPTNAPERDCVRRMAEAKWRAGVCMRMEFALLHAIDRGEACAMTGGDGLPSLNTLLRYRSRIERDYDRARVELEDLRRHRLRVEPLSDGGERQPANDYSSMDRALERLGTSEPEGVEPFEGMNREERRRLEAVRRKSGKRKR